jgi:hypothetical protein
MKIKIVVSEEIGYIEKCVLIQLSPNNDFEIVYEVIITNFAHKRLKKYWKE